MEGLYAVHKKSTAQPCAAACRSAIRLRRVRRGGVVGTADSSRDGDGAASGVFAGGAADRSAGTGGAGKGGVTMLAAIAYRTEDGGSSVVLLLSHIGGVLVVERRAKGVGKLVIDNHDQIDQSADTAKAESAEPEDTGANFADIKTVRPQTAEEQAKEQRNRALFLERLRRSLHRGAGLCLGLISDIVDGAAATIRTNQSLVSYLLTAFIAKHCKSSQQNQNNKLLQI